MFCNNCGNELKENTDVCLNCGKLNPHRKQEDNHVAKSLSTLALIFASLSFFPLIVFGSIAGMVLGVVSYNMNDQYKKRSKIAIWLSSISFILYFAILFIGLIVAMFGY